MLIKNRRGMSISIVLLVLATLVLTSFALFTFYLREKSIQEEIYTTRFLEEVYVKEEKINFYVQNIFDNSVRDFNRDEDVSKLINNFKQELGKYKINNKFVIAELEQVEGQINEEHIKVKNNKVTAGFQITIKSNVTDEKKEKEIFSAVYTYNKKFEKQI